jgi:hypothetical protein
VAGYGRFWNYTPRLCCSDDYGEMRYVRVRMTLCSSSHVCTSRGGCLSTLIETRVGWLTGYQSGLGSSMHCTACLRDGDGGDTSTISDGGTSHSGRRRLACKHTSLLGMDRISGRGSASLVSPMNRPSFRSLKYGNRDRVRGAPTASPASPQLDDAGEEP